MKEAAAAIGGCKKRFVMPTKSNDYMAMDSVFSAPSPMKVDSLTCLV